MLNAATVKYDLAFKRWGEFYFPGHDWRWWKAQGIAESDLRQECKSATGAMGIMQLEPETAREMGVDPLDPESNIQGGIKYDSILWRGWKAIAEADRRNFTFGAYNAGPGNILKAMRLCTNGVAWDLVAANLVHVTGPANAKQTTDYVRRINAAMAGAL